MLPELVFQDVLYCLHIMICSPLHLHGIAAWNPFHMLSFHQRFQVQQKPAIACLLRSKLAIHADCMDGTHRQRPAEGKPAVLTMVWNSSVHLLRKDARCFQCRNMACWPDALTHLLHLQRILQTKVPQDIIKELVCVTAEGWHLLYLRSWQMSLQQSLVPSTSLRLHHGIVAE